MHHYPHHIGDFRAGTVNMTRLERWLYRDMLDVYYDSEQPLPLDVGKLCRELGARADDEKIAIAEILDFKFTRTDRGYVHERCEAEIEAYRAKAETAKENGKKGGRPKKARDIPPAPDPAPEPEAKDNPEKPSGFSVGSNRDAIGNPSEIGSKTNQEPVTKNQEPVNPSLPTLSGEQPEAAPSANAEAPQAAGESNGDAQVSLLPADPADAQHVAPSVSSKRQKSKCGDDAMFCQAMAAYPARDGGNPRPAAWDAWCARRREGVEPAVMLAGVKRYAAWCEANHKVGTQYVPMAASFFGVKKPGFNEQWAIAPPTATPMRQQRPEKFDPFAYVSHATAQTHTDEHHESADCIDVEFREVDR